MPDFSLETAAHRSFGPHTRVCGVDEAGRGPIAGPVVAAAVILNPVRIPEGLDDSKRLSALRRTALTGALCRHAQIGLGLATVAEIDRLNILHASLAAMRRAILDLSAAPDVALVDGNQLPPAADLPCECRAVVRGDSLSLSIAAASIIAKTVRDRMLRALARRHPGFGWSRNAGYPTAAHLEALHQRGPTPHHRRSFRPVREAAAAG